MRFKLIVGVFVAVCGIVPATIAHARGGDTGRQILSSASDLTATTMKQIGLTDDQVLKKAAESFDLHENIIKAFSGMEAAEPFGKVKDALILLRLGLALDEGRQTDFNKILFEFVKEKSNEWLMSQAFPTQFNRLNIAVKLYKDQLEQLRDTVVIPEYEQRMYTRFRTLRDNNVTKENAFNEVTARVTLEPKSTWEYILSYSGYYMMKPQLYGKCEEKWKKNRGVKEITKTQQDQLWESLDKFWISRLEASYQIEKNRQRLAQYLLDRAKDEMRKSLMIQCVNAADDTPIGAFFVTATLASSKNASGRSRGGYAWLSGEYGYRIHPGTWKLTVQAEGFHPVPIPNKVGHLQGDSLPTKPKIHVVRLVPAGLLRVTVVDAETGQAINGAKVGLKMNDADGNPLSRSASTSGSVAVFDQLPPGTLTKLTVTAEGYESRSPSGNTTIPNKRPSVTIKLTPTPSGFVAAKWPNPNVFFSFGDHQILGGEYPAEFTVIRTLPLRESEFLEWRGKEAWKQELHIKDGACPFFRARFYVRPLQAGEETFLEDAQRGFQYFGANRNLEPFTKDAAVLRGKETGTKGTVVTETYFFVVAAGGYVAVIQEGSSRHHAAYDEARRLFLKTIRNRLIRAGEQR